MLKYWNKMVFTGLAIVALMGAPLYAAGKTAETGVTKLPASRVLEMLGRVNIEALERFGVYLEGKHPSVHARQKAKLAEIRRLYATGGLAEGVKKGDPQAIAVASTVLRLREELLLSNPELNFDRMYLIKHTGGKLPLPSNWESNSSIRGKGWNNAIMSMPLRGARKLKEVYRPNNTECITDIDLHFDGKSMLFSMPGKNQRWQVFELALDGTVAELPLIGDNDVDNYDACYLPDGNIIFTSTAPFIGVPCVKGSSHVTNCYLFNTKTKSIRRLTFDQEHNWCPTVTNSGQVMFLRWEYSDIPHFVSRILFTMNPDGTNQRGYYGTNSYWPNSIFYARPVPGSSSKFVGVVTGHHGVRRMGELVLFDAAKGYREADGVIQRIGGYGKKVEPVIVDRLADRSWPKFLHPYPINERFFIVSAKLSPKGNWGIYLVDVFDNMLLLKEEPGNALLEPTPIIARPKPPVIPSKVQPNRKDAVMFITDIYEGDGLKGVPRGSVKQLRLITYQFAYHDMGGQVNRVGLDGPWDVKRVLGTVPVEADGSAMFSVPADTPISIQPLDSRGRAIALMRSWATAMPGEVLSCVGCHEPPNKVVPASRRIASSKAPSIIKPWYGPTRGFSFVREVQPVLDKYCVGCHDGSKAKLPDFTDRPPVHAKAPNKTYAMGTKFPPSYIALRSYVRTPTIEGDIHLQPPYEFHASTTELIQRLEAGHHNVKLDRQGWDRLYTWIDLHAPAHGSWQEVVGEKLVSKYRQRRIDLMKQYSSRSDDEELIANAAEPVKAIMPEPMPPLVNRKQPKGLTAAQAVNQQKALGSFTKTVSAGGVKFELTRVPGGKSQLPFWIGTFEITNQQFQAFDNTHDARFEHGDFLVFSTRGMGYPLNKPEQPVCRVSWNEAVAFCQWLSKKTGHRFRLPEAAEWEYACRAGATTDHWYGPSTTDFSPYANLADQSFRHVDKFEFALPVGAVPKWRPAIETVNDKFHVSSPVGTFKPNPWGLNDMHGNAAEWTATGSDDSKVVKGGSWYDRPSRATTDFKLTYHPWQKVFNVGFRVVMEEKQAATIDAETVKKWSKQYRNWHYYPDHVIAPIPNVKGYEDVKKTDVPTVFQIPGDKKWYMTFIGFDGKGYQSFIAESDDLINWTNMRLAMGYGPKDSFDYGGVVLGAYLYEGYNIKAPRTLKKKDGKYYSLYGAYPRQGGYELRPGYEGVASSVDGITWKRAKDEPILSVHQKDCGKWEKSCIYQPWLVEHKGKFYNFYNAAGGRIEQIGLAISDDILNWKRYEHNPVIPNGPKGSYNEIFSSDGKVFRDGDHWVSFFFGVDKGGAHIMAAYSRDLFHWTVDPEPLYKSGGNPSGLDKKYAHKISLVWNPANETYYMFYNAVGNKGRGIGLITSKPLAK